MELSTSVDKNSEENQSFFEPSSVLETVVSDFDSSKRPEHIRIILSKCKSCKSIIKQNQQFCDKCRNKKNWEALLEIENHMGIAEKEEKEEKQKKHKNKRIRNKYLGGGSKAISNQLLFDNNRNHLPILTNVCSSSFKFITINENKFSLCNTCAFDSLFSIFLAATCKNDIFKQQVITKPKNSFFIIFKHLYNLKNMQVNNKIYQFRGNLY